MVFLAHDLIGKKLCTHFNDQYTSGIITETEAYRGWGDKACHANENRRTKRTEVMYQPGGIAYVYLCYGIHHLFNIITNQADNADAVLIRAIEPLEGTDIMLARRKRRKMDKTLSSGPGNVSQALGISTAHYGQSLTEDQIWLETYMAPPPENIVESTRIGVDYAGQDALLPWRFYLGSSDFVSKR